MPKKWLLKSGATVASLAMIASIAPALFAQENIATVRLLPEVEDAENVVVSSDDAPLVRHAKLKRSWVVFREIGSKTIYAVKKTNTKHAIQTLDFFTAYNANYHIKIVKAGRLDNLREGDPITSADGLNPADYRKSPGKHRLVKLPHKKAVYIITPDGKRRVIITESVFNRFGWEFRDVEDINENELGSYTEDDAVTDSTLFEEEVEVEETERRKLREDIFERLKHRAKNVVRKRLIKAHNRPEIYVLDGQGRKHKIRNMKALWRHKLDLDDTTEVTLEELEALDEADEIDDEGDGDFEDFDLDDVVDLD